MKEHWLEQEIAQLVHHEGALAGTRNSSMKEHWLEREIAQWVHNEGALAGTRNSSMGPP